MPTFNLVYADADGHIGHQCVGRIPIRGVVERGYRPGWDPRHQWQGTIPFDAMPHQDDPQCGLVVTANNRLAADDYPYPLSGTWSSGQRARRIRECLDSRPRWSAEACRQLQQDVRSGRAADCVPHIVALLADDTDPQVRQAVAVLAAWDFQLEPDRVAGALFNSFFVHWSRVVMAERTPASVAEFAAGSAGGLASSLLAADDVGWFTRRERGAAVRAALLAALDELASRLGPDLADWRWGRLHTLVQPHFLSGRGDLGELLDRNGVPVRGDVTTVCSSTPDAHYRAWLGASYRMVADLADPHQRLWASDVAGVSGHPGSPYYDDQLEPWSAGQYHEIALAGSDAVERLAALVLETAP